MIRNIYGNSASPLQGEVVAIVSNPTLRIGLISDVPAAQDDERNRPNPTLRIGLISDVPPAQDDERNRPNPTLRIGLMSDVPAAQDDERNRPNPTLRIGLISDVPPAQDDERNRPNPTLRIALISDVPPAQDDERNRPNPTLGIGLISVAPAERFMRSKTRAVVFIVVAMLLCSCSSRVVYEPRPITAASPDAININTAGLDELEKLPHIGRKTAEAIVNHRERYGAFRRVEHLMLMRGMSETRFAKLQTMVRTE